ncbi:hypothetical protein RRG08_006882 [Elysia crispata]|uniref:Uncharacterized protein n=1 Tax=Elysia crispata TaxID=231223 RepID=A0AAE1EC18_9GAST|nr:hypothetical protein RRG08_006882 [Elysia crispata]
MGELNTGRPSPTQRVPRWRIGERLQDMGVRSSGGRGVQAVLLPSRNPSKVRRRSYRAKRGALKPLPLL